MTEKTVRVYLEKEDCNVLAKGGPGQRLQRNVVPPEKLRSAVGRDPVAEKRGRCASDAIDHHLLAAGEVQRNQTSPFGRLLATGCSIRDPPCLTRDLRLAAVDGERALDGEEGLTIIIEAWPCSDLRL